jgi:uncharacterized repeat protein (TIGR03803 family)
MRFRIMQSRIMQSRRLIRTAAAISMSFAFFGHPANASTEKVIHHFVFPQNGQGPGSPLVADAAGNLYGNTSGGGTFNLGTVFELSPKTGGGWKETVLYSFSGPDGAFPNGRMRFDSAGNLYGSTREGGSSSPCSNFAAGCGVVFKLSPSTSGGWTETVLYRFTGGDDGIFPTTGVNFDAAGNIYGTTIQGGGTSCDNSSGCGTVFKLTLAAGVWTESVAYRFTGGSDGAYPAADVIFDSAGNLFGTTEEGGTSCVVDGELQTSGCGTVFELTPTSGSFTESVLYAFKAGADGNNPESDLVLDNLGPTGSLYGATIEGGGSGCSGGGCGTIFKLTPASGGWTESVLYAFKGGTDGAEPFSRLIFDSGVLYGTTNNGGTGSTNPLCVLNGCGTFFKLASTSKGWTESVLHRFTGTDGYLPGTLIMDSSGNLYGTAASGGVGGLGTIFELTHTSTSWTNTVLHNFQTVDGENAGTSAGGVIFDAAGNLYGTTEVGGLYSFGTVFEMTPTSTGWTEKVIYNFKGGTDGYMPEATLLLDKAGNLYGTTRLGGKTKVNCGVSPNSCGTVFELTPGVSGVWTKDTIYSFCSLAECSDGLLPSGGALIMDAAGNLYGTTQGGGNISCGEGGCGAVYKLAPTGSTWTESVLFSPGYGTQFRGSLTFDSAGNLFGANAIGGVRREGSAFELTPNSDGSWTEHQLWSFGAFTIDGHMPNGSFIFDSSGNFYGTTASGGKSNVGTVFEFSPVSGGGWTEKVLYSLANNGDNGAGVNGGLIFDSRGDLYGTTPGGVITGGIVFKLTPKSGAWTESVLHTFNGGKDGFTVDSGLAFDAAGNLYGTTTGNTLYNAGTVFEITP